MLLPSALPCDMRSTRSRSRFPASRLFSTPPPSDDELPSGNGLLGTCRALQSLLGSPAPSSRRTPKPERLQSPLNIRSTPTGRSRKVVKPSSPKQTPQSQPSRGANKRRRCDYEEEATRDSEFDLSLTSDPFSTPKRRRFAPYHLPLGLSQSDFYSLNSPPITQSPPSPAHQRQQELQPDNTQSFNPDTVLPSIEESDETNPDWTADDDDRLVELVLEKFKLSRQDWDDCARRMGKDQATLGRRWHSLVGEGNVGLRPRRRAVRARIDENWR